MIKGLRTSVLDPDSGVFWIQDLKKKIKKFN